MRRYFIGICGWFLIAACCLGQNFVTPTGIIIDPDAQAWVSGSWSWTLYNPSGGGNAHFIDGTAVPKNLGGSLDSTGAFQVGAQIPNNSKILPTGTQANLTVCSLTSAPNACQTIRIPITTDSPTVATQISARIQAPRQQAMNLTYNYNITEIENPTQGTGYINTVSNTCFLFSNGSYISCGGSASGTITPSPQTQIARYPNAGSAAVVKGTTGATSDDPGNVQTRTISSSVINNPEGSTGSFSQNNTFPITPDGQGVNPFDVQFFHLNASGPGNAVGNPPNITGGGWRVMKGWIGDGAVHTSGITQFTSQNNLKWGIGDLSYDYICPNVFGCFSGGSKTPSDQGDQIHVVNSTQFTNYCNGATTSNTTGDVNPPITCSGGGVGGSSIVVGGYLMDISKAQIDGHLTGTHAVAWEGAPNGLARISQDQTITPITAECIISGTTIPNSTVLNVPQSHSYTCTTNDSLVLSGTNVHAWIAGQGNQSEQVTILTASGTTTVTGTMMSALSHAAGDIIFVGSRQGTMQFDDDLTNFGTRTDFIVFGADPLHPTDLIIQYPGNSNGAVGLPITGINAESLTGEFHVWNAAEVMSVASDGVSPVTIGCGSNPCPPMLEQNTIPFTSGDSISSPPPSAYFETMAAYFSTESTQANVSNPSLGIDLVSLNAGASSAYVPFRYSSLAPYHFYDPTGTPLLNAPSPYQSQGAISNWFQMDDPLPPVPGGNLPCGGSTFICDLNTHHLTHDIKLFVDAQGFHNIIIHRSLSQVEFLDGIKVPNLIVTGSATLPNVVFTNVSNTFTADQTISDTGFAPMQIQSSNAFGAMFQSFNTSSNASWDWGSNGTNSSGLRSPGSWFLNLGAGGAAGDAIIVPTGAVPTIFPHGASTDGTNVYISTTGERGRSTLVAGTVTVSSTTVGATANIQLTDCTPGGTPGFLSVGTIVPTTSFVINSSNVADTSTVCWFLPK